MTEFLRIALWNANGLIRHKEEIILFLKEKHIDILLISETHLMAESYIKISNYRVYHTNHPAGTAHGGIAILIKQTIDKDCLQESRLLIPRMTLMTLIWALNTLVA
jgi:exonuclease III